MCSGKDMKEKEKNIKLYKAFALYKLIKYYDKNTARRYLFIK